MQANDRLVRLCCARNMIEARTIGRVLADHAIPFALVGLCKPQSPTDTRNSGPDTTSTSDTDAIDQRIAIVAWEDDLNRATRALKRHRESTTDRPSA